MSELLKNIDKNMIANCELKWFELLKIKCEHSRSWGNGNNGRYQCSEVCDKIINYIDHNTEYKISNNFISKFLEYITKQNYTGRYYKKDTCLEKNTVHLINTLKQIFKFNFPTNLHFVELIKKSNFFSVIKSLNSNPTMSGHIFDNDVVIMLIENYLLHTDNKECYTEIIDIILDHITIDTLTLNILCGSRSGYLNARVAAIIDKTTVELDSKFIHTAASVLPYSKEIIQSLIRRDIKINTTTLSSVCKLCNADSINFIFESSRMTPKKDNFMDLVKSCQYVLGGKNKNRYWDNDRVEYRDKQGSGYSMEKMEILINHGYKPTYADVLYGVEYKAEIPGIERFEIKTDKKLLEKCWKYDFYPGYKYDFMPDKMIELEKICCSRAPVKIKKFIKEQNLTPDKKCMENACSFKNNKVIVDHLISKGGVISIDCIKNCAKEFPANNMLMMIINNFKEKYTKDVAEYEKRISKLEEDIGQLKPKNVISDIETENTSKNVSQSDEDLNNTDKNLNNEDEINVLNIDDELDDDIIDEIIESTKYINIPESMTTKKPKQKRIKAHIPKKYAEYFNKKKGEKMTYIQLKKELIGLITKNEWLDNNDKKLIDLPLDLRKKLGINNNGYLKFEDIDKLTYLFYN
jgi:hypothetical protein